MFNHSCKMIGMSCNIYVEFGNQSIYFRAVTSDVMEMKNILLFLIWLIVSSDFLFSYHVHESAKFPLGSP